MAGTDRPTKHWTTDQLQAILAGRRVIARSENAVLLDLPDGVPTAPHDIDERWSAEIDRLHEDDRPQAIEAWWKAVRDPGVLVEFEVAIQADGQWYRERLGYLSLLHQPEFGVVLISFDRLEPIDEPSARPVGDAARYSSSPWLVQELDELGRIVRTEGTVEELFGLPAEALVGEEILDFLHPDDHAAAIAMWLEIITTRGETRTIEQRIRRPDGSSVWIASTVRNQIAETGTVLSVSHDITAQRRRAAELRSREHALRFVTESVPVGVFQADESGALVLTNQKFREVFDGVGTVEDMGGLVQPSDAGALETAIAELRAAGGTRQFRVRSADGLRHIEITVRGLIDTDAPDLGRWLIGTTDDVTAEVRRSFELEAIAERDPLTGLANRRGISRALTALTSDAENPVVVFGDLDSFKAVNDLYGHAAGDEVLCTIATRLRQAVRPNDVVGRWGGDEFVIVCADVAIGAEDELLDRLRVAATAPVVFDGGSSYSPAISLGAVRRRAGENDEDLLRRADTQMYEAKRRRHVDR